MEIEHLEIDSTAFGGNVLAIHGFSANDDLASAERSYVDKYRPMYVSCKVPIDALAEIAALEQHGFNFVECQLRSTIRLANRHDTSKFPYVFERVTTEDALADVLKIAGATFVDDRFCKDPRIGKPASSERYRRYVEKSFKTGDEAVYRLCDPQTKRTLAFKTHRYVGDDEVLFLLGGVHPGYKTVGLGVVNEYFEFNELYDKGIRKGTTHISAANYPVFNLEIGRLGFRVVAAFAVMRKMYG
ncbi:MAG: hypothetical protein PHU25_19835 [Deltaproteobacteria bacterium]|nr:hypothetical protein [Deltaproteobacteria bacterium]